MIISGETILILILSFVFFIIVVQSTKQYSRPYVNDAIKLEKMSRSGGKLRTRPGRLTAFPMAMFLHKTIKGGGEYLNKPLVMECRRRTKPVLLEQGEMLLRQ